MAEADYSVDLPSPQLIEQGRTNDLRIVVRRVAAIVAPSAATITITDATGTVLVDAAPATSLAGGIASYTTASTFDSSIRGMGWRLDWALTLDGKVRKYRAPAGLVACLPYPTVDDQWIWDRVPMLNAGLAGAVTKAASHQTTIDRTWREILKWVDRQGTRPHLVLSQDDLQEPHGLLTISRIFEGLAVNQPKFADMASLYLKKYELALVNVQVDTVSDADDSSRQKRKAVRGSLWACGR